MGDNADLEVDDEMLMKSMTLAQKIYADPAFILGSTAHVKRKTRGFNFQTGKIVEMEVTVPMVPEQIFLEMTANVMDEMNHLIEKYPRDKIPFIEITIDRERVTVKNPWLPRKGTKELEIACGKNSKKWVPERAFGSFLNSGHYDEKNSRNAGRNGLGAKGANLFSASFLAHLNDSLLSKHQYVQQWANNMSQVSAPGIYPTSGGDSFVLISYVLLFSRFDMTQYPDDFYCLVAKHCHDMAMSSRVPVRVTMGFDRSAHQTNGYPIPPTDPEFAKLFTFICDHPNRESYAKLIEFGKDEELSSAKFILRREGDSDDKPALEFILMDTPNRPQVISFANGVNTRDHGQYIVDLIDEVSRGVIEVMKEKMAKTEEKRIKALMKTGETKRISFPLTIKDVKEHLSYFICISGSDVKFENQIKTRLLEETVFPFKGKIDLDEIKKLAKWRVFEKLINTYNAKNDKKSEKHSKGGMSMKLIDANNAKKKTGEPALFLIEGDSAKNYTVVLFGILGRDNFGSLPLRGKIQNAMRADQFQISSNKEFIEIAKAVGLERGVDYRIDENYRRLRYKYVILLGDSDLDAKHIIGLLLNYLYVLYPTFLQRPGTVMIWKTPIKRVWKKSSPHNKIAICSTAEEDQWKRSNPDWDTWESKYYKGLGSSTKENVQEDAKHKRVVTCLYDDRAPDAFKYSFHKDFTDVRKQWIEQWAPNIEVEEMTTQPISLFLYYVFGEYNCANVIRSIPSYMDGLKPSLRKVIHTAFEVWGDRVQKHIKDMKVMNFAAKAMDLTEYHHGDMSMRGVIIGMAQNFLGSNNLPYLVPDGMFGTRMEGGKDASSARYLFTYPQKYLSYLFRPEDTPLLQYLREEKTPIEPKFYLPVICPVYNGQSGIGTGWSSFIPNYNPHDIIAWHRAKILGKPLPVLKPYYHGFKGTIELINSNDAGNTPTKLDEKDVANIIKLENEHDELAEKGIDPNTIIVEDGVVKIEEGPAADMKEVDESVKNRVVIKGIFKEIDENTVKIEELAIGSWTMNYKNWLDMLVDPKKKKDKKKKKAETKEENKTVEEPRLNDYTDEINDVDAIFNLFGLGFKPTHKSLKLVKNYGMENMVMLNSLGKPIKFPTILSILETFHKERLPYYELRKSSMLQKLADNVTSLYDKIKFIRAVLDKQLIVEKRPKKEVQADMLKLGIPTKLLGTGIDKLTDDEIKSLWNDAEKARAEYDELAKIPIEILWMNDLDDLERHLPY